MTGVTKLKLLVVAVAASAAGSGCVQPWVAQRMDEKFLFQNDPGNRTPILPPIRDGFPAPVCEDPPTDGEILRALPKRIRGVPYFYEEFHDDHVFQKTRVVDKIDPPRFFPLVGMAQLHHCHWECSVYYTETIQSAYPYPTFLKKPRVQVVYIDKDHLHLYAGENPDAQRDLLLEMTKY